MGSYAKTNKLGNANFGSFVFIGVDGVCLLLVCDMASDSHKNGYLTGKHPEGAFDILLSLLFINTFNAN